MPLPGWFVQQAYEDYIAEQKAFQEWCEAMEQEYTVSEFYVRTRPKHVRPRRYCHKK